jgi:hypothetical protein
MKPRASSPAVRIWGGVVGHVRNRIVTLLFTHETTLPRPQVGRDQSGGPGSLIPGSPAWWWVSRHVVRRKAGCGDCVRVAVCDTNARAGSSNLLAPMVAEFHLCGPKPPVGARKGETRRGGEGVCGTPLIAGRGSCAEGGDSSPQLDEGVTKGSGPRYPPLTTESPPSSSATRRLCRGPGHEPEVVSMLRCMWHSMDTPCILRWHGSDIRVDSPHGAIHSSFGAPGVASPPRPQSYGSLQTGCSATGDWSAFHASQ